MAGIVISRLIGGAALASLLLLNLGTLGCGRNRQAGEFSAFPASGGGAHYVTVITDSGEGGSSNVGLSYARTSDLELVESSAERMRVGSELEVVEDSEGVTYLVDGVVEGPLFRAGGRWAPVAGTSALTEDGRAALRTRQARVWRSDDGVLRLLVRERAFELADRAIGGEQVVPNPPGAELAVAATPFGPTLHVAFRMPGRVASVQRLDCGDAGCAWSGTATIALPDRLSHPTVIVTETGRTAIVQTMNTEGTGSELQVLSADGALAFPDYGSISRAVPRPRPGGGFALALVTWTPLRQVRVLFFDDDFALESDHLITEEHFGSIELFVGRASDGGELVRLVQLDGFAVAEREVTSADGVVAERRVELAREF